MNIQKCCRLCTAEGDKVLVNLLDNVEMMKSVEKLFPLKIANNEGITTSVCVDCYREVIDIKKSLERYESKKSAVMMNNQLLKTYTGQVVNNNGLKKEAENNKQIKIESNQTANSHSEIRIVKEKMNVGRTTVTPLKMKAPIPPHQQNGSVSKTPVPATSPPKKETPTNSGIRRTERKRKPVQPFEEMETVTKKKTKAPASPTVPTPAVPPILDSLSLKRLSTGEVTSAYKIIKQYTQSPNASMEKSQNERVINVTNSDGQQKSFKLIKSDDSKYKLISSSPSLTIKSVKTINRSIPNSPEKIES